MKTIDEKIRKAARTYGDTQVKSALTLNREPESSDRHIKAFNAYNLETAFELGAKWALSHQWVSVDEELPPIQEDVLVMTNERIDIAYREEDSIHFVGNMFDYDASQIVAWMPIPPLPEARKEGEV